LEYEYLRLTYTEDNEPYSKLQSLSQFDNEIQWSIDLDKRTNPIIERDKISELQIIISKIYPQGIGIALGIRELVKQAYLFGALTLLRPLLERVAVISYIEKEKNGIEIWKNGWKHNERPSLFEMLKTIPDLKVDDDSIRGLKDFYNSLIHGDPMSSPWNTYKDNENKIRYASGRIETDENTCNYICIAGFHFIYLLNKRLDSIFPFNTVTTSD
jgi:hypothetical protein